LALRSLPQEQHNLSHSVRLVTREETMAVAFSC
jgi:hypothetical protein